MQGYYYYYLSRAKLQEGFLAKHPNPSPNSNPNQPIKSHNLSAFYSNQCAEAKSLYALAAALAEFIAIIDGAQVGEDEGGGDNDGTLLNNLVTRLDAIKPANIWWFNGLYSQFEEFQRIVCDLKHHSRKIHICGTKQNDEVQQNFELECSIEDLIDAFYKRAGELREKIATTAHDKYYGLANFFGMSLGGLVNVISLPVTVCVYLVKAAIKVCTGIWLYNIADCVTDNLKGTGIKAKDKTKKESPRTNFAYTYRRHNQVLACRCNRVVEFTGEGNSMSQQHIIVLCNHMCQ
jgi:hypothetical protein